MQLSSKRPHELLRDHFPYQSALIRLAAYRRNCGFTSRNATRDSMRVQDSFYGIFAGNADPVARGTDMARVAKLIVYVALTSCAIILARRFVYEHARVVDGAASASRSRMMEYFGGFLAAVVILGPMCAYDVSHFLGDRAEQWILQGGPPNLPAPECVEAERLLAARQPLAAIESLRDYLRKNPAEWRAKARIAEIYNRELKNHPAAMLEYEELLAGRLDAEAWGWAALHLAKIYGRLNQPDRAEKLLRRLEADYGRTLAARRARQKMAEMDS
jgi:tetratricopeptide (TPR) repeat protein